MDGTAGDSVRLERLLDFGRLPGMWYTHARGNRRGLHFLSAMHHSKLLLLGGFHPAMANGTGSDDMEFRLRASRVTKFEHVGVEGLFGVHMWHKKHLRDPSLVKNITSRIAYNEAILAKTKADANFIHVDHATELRRAYDQFTCIRSYPSS